MTKHEIKTKLKNIPHWVTLVSEKAGVSENQVRSVFSGGHKDKHGILTCAEALISSS